MIKKIITYLKKVYKNLTTNDGFTLIEIMIVITIMAILGGLVLPSFMDMPKKARVSSAKQQIKLFELPIQRYQMEKGQPPTTEEGLDVLVSEGYIKKIPLDPWETPYQYRSPGEHGGDYDIWSLGADKKSGGEGFDADINSWE